MRNEIIKLATDLAHGRVQNFSVQESNETLRKAFAELGQFSIDERGTIDRKAFRRHKTEIFEILEVVINEYLQEGLKNQFDQFAEYRNLAWGDTNLFKTPAEQIFRVSLVSDGNGNIRRQRLRDGQEFSVGLDTYAIKIAEDFHRFLAGRVQWADLMKGIAESFKRDLTQRIADAVMASYGEYSATYHNTFTTTGTEAFNENDLIEMAMHIKARTGSQPAVYGTKLALRRLKPEFTTEVLNNERNTKGYYGEIAGIKLMEIEQSHAYGTDNFAISNDFLLLLPQNADKMVKVINEGDAIIQEQQAGVSADMMQEYFIANRFGIAIICTKVFGFIKFINN
ncbi:hypothetical protein JDW21_19670 [Bacillus subtilis]|uniref:hypothetical protein n=1 Tax=Bacillus subtilis group TaxID=653685 RepID=UPI00200C7ACC|nr:MULTISPECIES: hypothetical protein [Bacillus subtilis group]MCR4361968.1 hypothetical protein [Bacillus subtilis]UQB84215.1 hypothetical protein KMZ31_20035 [Bacillus amyloliquefaciens]